MAKKFLVLAAVLAALIPASAFAQSPVLGGIGPRVGLSIDPDQIVFGGQAVIGELAPDLTFDPSLEIGIGDDVSVIALNFDLHYHFRLEGSSWRPYAGGGIGINFIEVDVPAPFEDVSDTEVGLNVVLGAGAPTADGNRFFGELRIGVGDIPELKLIAGWNFKI